MKLCPHCFWRSEQPDGFWDTALDRVSHTPQHLFLSTDYRGQRDNQHRSQSLYLDRQILPAPSLPEHSTQFTDPSTLKRLVCPQSLGNFNFLKGHNLDNTKWDLFQHTQENPISICKGGTLPHPDPSKKPKPFPLEQTCFNQALKHGRPAETGEQPTYSSDTTSVYPTPEEAGKNLPLTWGDSRIKHLPLTWGSSRLRIWLEKHRFLENCPVYKKPAT